MSNITISINLLNTLPNVIELEWFLDVFTILLFVTGASTNYSIPIPCQTNYEQFKTTASKPTVPVLATVYPGENIPVLRSDQ